MTVASLSPGLVVRISIAAVLLYCTSTSSPSFAATKKASPALSHTNGAKAKAAKAAAKPAAAGAQSSDAATQTSDLDFVLKLQFKSLKFETVPKVTVTFPTSPKGINSDITDRRNVPDKFVAGKTYRDGGLTWHVSTSLGDVADVTGAEPSASAGANTTAETSQPDAGAEPRK